jgi:hypothetical protein
MAWHGPALVRRSPALDVAQLGPAWPAQHGTVWPSPQLGAAWHGSAPARRSRKQREWLYDGRMIDTSKSRRVA